MEASPGEHLPDAPAPPPAAGCADLIKNPDIRYQMIQSAFEDKVLVVHGHSYGDPPNTVACSHPVISYAQSGYRMYGNEAAWVLEQLDEFGCMPDRPFLPLTESADTDDTIRGTVMFRYNSDVSPDYESFFDVCHGRPDPYEVLCQNSE